MFSKGVYNIRKMIALGFLYCNHSDMVSKREELWGMFNPTIQPKIKKETLRDVLYALFYFSIFVHLDYEESKDVKNKELI